MVHRPSKSPTLCISFLLSDSRLSILGRCAAKNWGMPNISSVQDYDHGPEGATPSGPGKPAA